ncbi:MAG: lasso peptide biosynthesis B2 protein [Solirubrobacteraceae bacterium]
MVSSRPEPHEITGSATLIARHPPDERLSHAQRLRLAAEVLAAYAQSRRALRRAPIASVVASLRREAAPDPDPDPAPATGTLEEARRLGRAVTRTLRLVPGDTRCLVRSLVLTRLLARRHIPAKLVIGARAAPDFLAHAWVEHAGVPVLSAGDGSFARLVEL